MMYVSLVVLQMVCAFCGWLICDALGWKSREAAWWAGIAGAHVGAIAFGFIVGSAYKDEVRS